MGEGGRTKVVGRGERGAENENRALLPCPDVSGRGGRKARKVKTGHRCPENKVGPNEQVTRNHCVKEEFMLAFGNHKCN